MTYFFQAFLFGLERENFLMFSRGTLIPDVWAALSGSLALGDGVLLGCVYSVNPD